MSYWYLPLPIFLALSITLSVSLIVIAIKRRKIDRNGLVVLYITISISGFISSFLKVQKEIGILNLLYDIMVWILFGSIALIFIELFYLSVTLKGTRESRIRVYIGWGIILFSLLLGLVMFFMLD